MKATTKKKLTMAMAAFLALLIIIPILISALSATASATSSKEELEQLKAEAEELANQKEEIENEIAYIEQQQVATIETKTMLDEQILLTQAEITNANAQLQQYTILIADMQQDIDQAMLDEQAQYELVQERIRIIEENGTASYWSIIFGAESFSDLLDRIDFVNELLAYDQGVIDKLYEMRAELDAAQAELEQSKAEQKEIKDTLVQLEADLESQRASADELMVKLTAEKEDLEQFYAEMEEQEVLVAQQIDEMVAKIAEEERLAAQSGTTTGYVTGTGSFTWPTPSCTYITSYFGNRLHPTLGVYKFHTGVDIGASYGASILAADDGTVITAGYNEGGYGNYVVISHGNGMTTLYGHMSSIAVSYGQNVTKGQTIGYVGSTGRSTGPHLHFEIRQNGQYLDPLSYFSF